MPFGIAVLIALVVAAGGACSDDKSYVEKVVHELRAGDCFDGGTYPPETPEGERPTALVVATLPCSVPHQREVFGVFEHPAKAGDPFPGQEEVSEVAQDGCAERFASYVGRPFEESDLQVSVIAPGPLNWDRENDRTIVCTLQSDKPLTGSQKSDD